MKWLIIILETFPFLLSLFAVFLVFEKIVEALKEKDTLLCFLLSGLLLFTVFAVLYFLFYLVISLGTKIEGYDERLK